MQTVHTWSVFHELLKNHPEAIAARKEGVMSVLVLMDKGMVVQVHRPPNGEDFRTEDHWIATAIQQAWYLGTHAVLDAMVANQGLDAKAIGKKILEDKAPPGWILWKEMKPGTLAFDGIDQHVLLFPEAFEHSIWEGPITKGFGIDLGLVSRLKERKEMHTAVDLASTHNTESVFTFNPKKPRQAYLRVIRADLTQTQCVNIRQLCRNMTMLGVDGVLAHLGL